MDSLIFIILSINAQRSISFDFAMHARKWKFYLCKLMSDSVFSANLSGNQCVADTAERVNNFNHGSTAERLRLHHTTFATVVVIILPIMSHFV